MIRDPQKLREAFGCFMTGVTVVTTNDALNNPIGFTANSFSSVSLNPPLLLVCPGNHLSSIEVFRNCETFAVNVLAEEQEEISNTFARSSANRFEDVSWQTSNSGLPILADALAIFCCKTHRVVEAGDHIILVGEIQEFSSKEGRALGYWKGGYFRLGDERRADTTTDSGQEIQIGAIVEYDDKIVALPSSKGLRLPSGLLPEQTKARDGMHRQLEALGIDGDIGRMFSIFHQQDRKRQFMYFKASAKSEINNNELKMLTTEEALSSNWKMKAEATMVRRYVTERHNNAFGLYIGDTEDGEVHENG